MAAKTPHQMATCSFRYALDGEKNAPVMLDSACTAAATGTSSRKIPALHAAVSLLCMEGSEPGFQITTR